MKLKYISILVAALLTACGGGGGGDKLDNMCTDATGRQQSCTNNQGGVAVPEQPVHVVVTPGSQPQTQPVAPPDTNANRPQGAPAPQVESPPRVPPEPAPSVMSAEQTSEGIAPDGYAWGFAINEYSAPVDGWQSCVALPIYVWGNELTRVELVHPTDVHTVYGKFDVIEHDTFASLLMTTSNMGVGWITARVIAYDDFGKWKEVMPTRSWYLYDDPNCSMSAGHRQ